MSNNTTLIIILSLTSIVLFIVISPFIYKIFQLCFKKNKYNSMGQSSQTRLVYQLYDAVKELSSTKTGAIITIVNKDSLDRLRTDGVIINANIVSALLISIFNKNSPLHDGAVIIEGGKIKYAATYYKITQNSIANKYGARHRAGLGIAEQSDSITIIVSEETGGVSIAMQGEIILMTLKEFKEKLTKILK